MKTTAYFREQVLRKRPYIQLDWCERIAAQPDANAFPGYDRETDSLYIDLNARPSVDSREVQDGVALDFDAEGQIVGIDIQHASEILDLATLETESLPISN